MVPNVTRTQFETLIAHLPFIVVERNQFNGLALMPKDEARDSADHLWHALQIEGNRQGLRTRRGCVVWTVNGFKREAK